MQLTKEQIEALEEGASNGLCSVKGPLLSELVRGYCRYLEAVEHHAKQAEHWKDWELSDYHRARLAALKGQG